MWPAKALREVTTGAEPEELKWSFPREGTASAAAPRWGHAAGFTKVPCGCENKKTGMTLRI